MSFYLHVRSRGEDSRSSPGSDFGSDTNISQLTMVPVFDAHDSNGPIQSDRMLLLSGALSSSAFGNASSVLFDGQSFVPYIVSTSASGSPGAVSGLIHSFASFSFARRREFTLPTYNRVSKCEIF